MTRWSTSHAATTPGSECGNDEGRPCTLSHSHPPPCARYFLITPKLLPNLTYHDRMKVLIINNGEWIPDNGFDFGHYVRTKRRQLVGSGRMAPAAPVAV